MSGGCSTGYYLRSDDNTCQPCEPTCKNCDNGSVNGCNSCRDGEYLNSNKMCLPCDFLCKTCVSYPEKCESCNLGRFLFDSKCVEICPDGTYPKASDNTCQSCDNSCNTCNGPNPNECMSCIEAKYLTSSKTCDNCDSTCKTCETTSTKCLSCTTPKYLSTSGNNCIDSCPTGEFARDADRTCQPCDSSCMKCLGSSLKDCTDCNSGDYLSGSRCLPCDSTCKTCFEGTSTECLSCDPPLVFYLNACYNLCPDGKYAEVSNNECMSCDANCVTCSTTSTNCETCKTNEYKSLTNICNVCDTTLCKTCIDSSNKCLSCNSPRFLENNNCVSKCQDGTYGDSLDNKCKICNAKCLTCNGPATTNCNSCVNGITLIGAGECKDCHSTCLTCTGFTSSYCITCQSSLYLKDNTCLVVCQVGTYSVETPYKKCVNCYSSCSTCVGGNPVDCKVCKTNYYFNLIDKVSNTGECKKICNLPLVLSLRTAKCETSCPTDQYEDSFTNTCKDCNKNCKTCRGALTIDCTSCNEDKIYYPYTCVNDCPKGYYADINSKICKKCPQFCEICSDQTTCKTCSEDTYIISTTTECSKCEQDGFFIDPIYKTCNTCSSHCTKCSSFEKCFECDQYAILNNYKCNELKFVKPELSIRQDSYFLFNLIFNQTWAEYFKNITKITNINYIQIYLDDPPGFNCSIGNSLISELWFEIYCPLNKGFNSLASLIVELNPSQEKVYKLTQKKLTLLLSILPTVSCNNLQIYNNTSEKCQDLEIIVPILKNTDSPLKLSLEFSDIFEELFSKLTTVSIISISDLDEKTFNFTITKSNSNTFDIDLSFLNYFYDIKYFYLIIFFFNN